MHARVATSAILLVLFLAIASATPLAVPRDVAVSKRYEVPSIVKSTDWAKYWGSWMNDWQSDSPSSSPPPPTAPTSPPATPPPPPSSDLPTAYVTYHAYSPTTPLLTVACSDGTNGLITGGYTMAGMYPSVSAASFAVWNSPECGGCWTLTNAETGVAVQVTVIDACGPVAGYAAHFDLSPEIFNVLGGDDGVQAGHLMASYVKNGSEPCRY